MTIELPNDVNIKHYRRIFNYLSYC